MAYIGQPKDIPIKSLDGLNIEFEELTDDLQFVADKCGIDTARELIKNLQGTNIYIPKISKMRDYIIRYIKENSDKKTKQLATELDVSENFVRQLRYEIW